MKMEIADFRAKKFLNDLKASFKELEKIYMDLGVNLNGKIPKVFSNFEETEVRVIYSYNTKEYLFIFDSKKGPGYRFHYEKNINHNILPYIGNVEGVITNTEIKYNSDLIFKWEYAYIMPEHVFNEKSKNTLELANNIISSSLDYFSYKLSAPKKEKNKNSFISKLRNLAEQFSKLINDDAVGELAIDKFLEKNPVILERALQLTKLNHQCVLKNILFKYPHDLKPDLIAYNVYKKCWTIIDYKKANKNILKNTYKTRTGLLAEVHSLKDQLSDYIEYFEEREHRDYFEVKYGIEIKNPVGVGIIGKVYPEFEDEFNRKLKHEPNWFDIVPYNYLYDRYIEYINATEKVLQE